MTQQQNVDFSPEEFNLLRVKLIPLFLPTICTSCYCTIFIIIFADKYTMNAYWTKPEPIFICQVPYSYITLSYCESKTIRHLLILNRMSKTCSNLDGIFHWTLICHFIGKVLMNQLMLPLPGTPRSSEPWWECPVSPAPRCTRTVPQLYCWCDIQMRHLWQT